MSAALVIIVTVCLCVLYFRCYRSIFSTVR